MKTFFVVLLSLFLIPSYLVCQDNPTDEASRLIEKYFELGQFNGCVLVAEKDSILLKKAYGTAEFDAGEKLAENSVFQLASVSKSITAAAVLILVQQKKISLEDQLIKFFPGLPYKGVKIKHLLSNTSGIPEYRPYFFESWNRSKVAINKDVIKLFSEKKPPLEFEPGTKFRYSNTGFVFLASITEKVTGKKFEDFLKQNIFKPAGMNSSIIFRRDKQYSIKNFAFPYIRVSLMNPVLVRPETAEQLSFLNYLDGIKGDVSTSSTTEDLYKMDYALISGKLLKKKVLEETFTPFISRDNPGSGLEGYGYGWYITRNKKNEKIALHDGTMPGVVTYNYINFDDSRFIIVLGNTNFCRSAEMAEKIAMIYEGEKVPDPKPLFTLQVINRIREKGTEGFHDFWKELMESGGYEASEPELNAAGYELLQSGSIDAAIEIFKINTEVFPKSWNAYDSLGEGYFTKGDYENAEMNYNKSLELNPGNDNAKNFITRIRESKK